MGFNSGLKGLIVKEKYFMKNTNPAGILLNSNAMIYLEFKLQLIKLRYNKN
jgi:hypothetical protein